MSVQASALSKHIHATIKSTKALLTLDKPPVAKWEKSQFYFKSQFLHRELPEEQSSICNNSITMLFSSFGK